MVEGGWGGPYEPRYRPIESYGLIGDLRTAALVGVDGSIDWFCPRRFDAPSLFGAILDADSGGAFRIAPTSPVPSKQMYLPDTAVLVTRFYSDEGVGEVTDFMPARARALRTHAPGGRGARRGGVPHVVPPGLRLRAAPATAWTCPGSAWRASRPTGDPPPSCAASVPLEAEGPAAEQPLPPARGRERLVRVAARRRAASDGPTSR